MLVASSLSGCAELLNEKGRCITGAYWKLRLVAGQWYTRSDVDCADK